MKATNVLKIHKTICTSMFFTKNAWCCLNLLALKLIFHISLNKGFLILARLKCAAIN